MGYAIRSYHHCNSYPGSTCASSAAHSEGFAPDAVDTREAVTTQPDGYPSLPIAVQSLMLAKSEASEAARSRPLTGIRAVVSELLGRAWI